MVTQHAQRPKARIKLVRTSTPANRSFVELEFSEHGRSARVLPGWWIAPGMILGAALILWPLS